MDFRVQKKEHWNINKYNADDFKLSCRFADVLIKEAPGLLSSIVLFGSSARGDKKSNDIDILLIVNDVSIILTPESSEAFRIIIEKSAGRISNKFHITTVKLSNFWDYLRLGDPIGLNMLRDGVPLYDSGIFEPAQQLLFQGKIRPSKEAIWVYAARSPNTLQNSQWHVLQATLDLYWAVSDSAHAALMSIGEMPPTPGHLADMLQEKFVKSGFLEKRYAEIMRNMHKIAKMIARREIQEVSGQAYDRYLKEAHDFVSVMKKIIENE